MPITQAKPAARFHDAQADERLVRECLRGNQDAWSELIDKYKNLIYSIPIKYGFSQDDASDIFQEVCLGLLSELATVREPRALAKWLIQVTSHKCYHWKRRNQRQVSLDAEEQSLPDLEVSPEVVELLHQAEQEQRLREALTGLRSRCRQLIEMLFFEDPRRPYLEVAESLGIAVGSIGFLRQRCLGRLRKHLYEMGFA
jgi:RNA polymerase sigma factor (sigma-70 family)